MAPSPAPASTLEWISGLRILALFEVVMTHVSGYVFRDYPGELTLRWWTGNVYNSTSRWAVPAFVMISGFLLLRQGKEEAAPVFYRKRASRIVIPLLFWSLFYLAFDAVVQHRALSGREILSRVLLQGDAERHLWFLYMIGGLYLVTPLLRRLLSCLSSREIGWLCLAFFLISVQVPLFLLGRSGMRAVFEIDSRPVWLSWCVPYIGYFLLGSLAGRAEARPRRLVALAAVVAGCLATIIGTAILHSRLGATPLARYFQHNLSPPVILTTWGLFAFMQTLPTGGLRRGWIDGVSAAMLGVYVMHPFFISVLWRVGIDVDIVHPVVSLPLVTTLVFFLSLLPTLGLQRTPILGRIV